MIRELKDVLIDDFWIMPQTPQYIEKGIPYITSKNIKNGRISFENINYISQEDYRKISKNRPIKKDDILISMIGTLGETAIVDDSYGEFYGQNMFLVRLDSSKIDYQYFMHYFKSEVVKNQLIKSQNKSTQSYLKAGHIEKLRIPIYEMAEQKRIANILNKSQFLIETKKQQIESFNELIKSQFVEMFGDIKNTKYSVMKLQELTNLITDGEHKKPNYTDEGKPFISVVNITTGELRFDNCKFVSDEDTLKFQKRCKPEKDDILYTKVGATYGRSAIVNTDKDFSLYVSVCLIKPKKNLVNPIFLNYTLRQPYIKIQADKCIKGIGVPDLHLIEIKNFNIIVPPIELQNRFAEFVKQVGKLKFEIEKSLKEMQELYDSLMEKYFG